MTQPRRADVILSVPPLVASPNLATAPQGSISLSAMQYMLGITVVPPMTVPVFTNLHVPPAGRNTMINVNASVVPPGRTPVYFPPL